MKVYIVFNHDNDGVGLLEQVFYTYLDAKQYCNRRVKDVGISNDVKWDDDNGILVYRPNRWFDITEREIKERELRYCLRCGKELTGTTAIVELERKEGDDYLRYDIYCEHCEWSGIILPEVP